MSIQSLNWYSPCQLPGRSAKQYGHMLSSPECLSRGTSRNASLLEVELPHRMQSIGVSVSPRGGDIYRYSYALHSGNHTVAIANKVRAIAP